MPNAAYADRQGAPSVSRGDLESLLRLRQLDHTLTSADAAPDPRDARWILPTGVSALDGRLQGGIPRGQLSEFVGPRSSGCLAVVVSALAGATARGEVVALVDPLDMFDPNSAAASGIDFERMLWIRGEASSAARTGLSCEYGRLQKSLHVAVKALNLVLQAGGFGLVVLDLAPLMDIAPHAIKRLPFTTWLRLQRIIEGSETACVLMGAEPIARSAGGVTIQMVPGGLQASGLTARVSRARKVESDHHVRVPVSAAAC